jgi:transcriptional regulator with XRE-family HTH domain
VTKADFGQRLRELRKAAGLTQADVAARMGTTQSRISEWETAAHTPFVTEVPELAEALGVDVAELFKPPAKPRRGKKR